MHAVQKRVTQGMKAAFASVAAFGTIQCLLRIMGSHLCVHDGVAIFDDFRVWSLETPMYLWYQQLQYQYQQTS